MLFKLISNISNALKIAMLSPESTLRQGPSKTGLNRRTINSCVLPNIELVGISEFRFVNDSLILER